MKSARFLLPALGLAFAAAAQAQLKPPTRTETAPRNAAPAPAPVQAQAPAPSDGAGVISNPDMEKVGQTAAHAWLLLLDRKDWGTAWDSSSTMFRQAVPLPAWMDGIPKLREPLGAFVERQPLGAAYKKTLAGRPDGDYVTVVFQSKFANKADVQETVTTVRDTDGRWRVTGYTAR